MDRLSDLPLSIIETILCLIPIQEAGRTSILSREWRYRWTKIPKLVFKESTFQVSNVGVDAAELFILEQEYLEPHKRHNMYRKNKLMYAASQVLLMHDGPIHEFTLSLLRSDERVKIDPILIHLSRKTSVKKLKLDFGRAQHTLPSSICSFRQLTDLCLIGCYFDHQPTFNGFGNLTNLYLQGVFLSTKTLLDLLSSCPLLKTVILNIRGIHIWSNDSPTFMELYECLFECLPAVIETLSLSFDLVDVFEDNVDGRVPRELPTPLFHLKYLSINHVCFHRKEELILALLIKSCPNLETLKILDYSVYPSQKSSSIVECYPGIMLEHLNELEIRDFVTHKTQFDFVKLILARSPVLKKVRIILHCKYWDEKFQISEILSGYSRASPEVQISVIRADHVHHQRYKSLSRTIALCDLILSTSM